MRDPMKEHERRFTGRKVADTVERAFWPNGKLQSERGIREDGSEAWTFWYPDGTVQQEMTPGTAPGVTTVRRYRPDGTLRSAIDYRNGKKHGAWREFAADGTLVRERLYEDGKPASEAPSPAKPRP